MRDRLDILLAQLEDDSLSAAAADELAELLESRPEYRAIAAGQLVLSSQLNDLLGESAAAPSPSITPARPAPVAQPWRLTPGRAAIAMTALALAAFAAWPVAGWRLRAPLANDSATAATAKDVAGAQPAAVAVLTRVTDDARWSAGQIAPPNKRLVIGQMLCLESGAAELRFLSGAQLNLQGPARLELESENGAILHRGTATAQVPPQAIGFTLWSPTMAVVDLGTEFGLRVREEGTTDVQVFEGAVEAEWAPGNSRESRTLLISTEEAARLDRLSGEMARLPPQIVGIPRLAFTAARAADARAVDGQSIVADFSDESTANPGDQYPGRRGAGWETSWNPLSSSKVKSERVLASEHPLLGSGAYLRLAHHSSLEGIGTQTRVYERRQYAGFEQIALDRPHTISWLWRLDSVAGFDNPRGDYFKFFDSTRFDTIAHDDETTWAVAVHPQGTIKFVNALEKPDRAPQKVVIGHVYEFTIEVDPERNQYRGRVRQFDPLADNKLVADYRSPPLAFRNASKKPGRVGGFLHLGPGLDHSDNDGVEPENGTQTTYSLDRIRIAPPEGEPK